MTRYRFEAPRHRPVLRRIGSVGRPGVFYLRERHETMEIAENEKHLLGGETSESIALSFWTSDMRIAIGQLTFPGQTLKNPLLWARRAEKMVERAEEMTPNGKMTLAQWEPLFQKVIFPAWNAMAMLSGDLTGEME